MRLNKPTGEQTFIFVVGICAVAQALAMAYYFFLPFFDAGYMLGTWLRHFFVS